MNPFQGDLIYVVIIVVLLFGASQVPKLARSIGQAKREFQQGMKEGEKEPVEGACPFCSTEVPEDSKFCPNCGKSADEIRTEKTKQKSA